MVDSRVKTKHSFLAKHKFGGSVKGGESFFRHLQPWVFLNIENNVWRHFNFKLAKKRLGAFSKIFVAKKRLKAFLNIFPPKKVFSST